MARPEVLAEIDKAYRRKSYSNMILNTPVDYERLRNNPKSAEEIANIKEKYKIKTFESRAKFNFNYNDEAVTAVVHNINLANKQAEARGEKLPYRFKSSQTREKFIAREVDKKLNQWWEYYQHRELLIESGQYSELRTNQYREQYLSHLRLANVDSSVIANIEKLTPEEWERLVQQPDADTTSIKTRELPSLTNIYSYEVYESNYKAIREEIVEAFQSTGLVFDKELGKEEQPDVIKRRKFRLLADAYAEGRLDIRIKPNGEYAIPFIGSTDGKSKEIANEFIDYLENHGYFD